MESERQSNMKQVTLFLIMLTIGICSSRPRYIAIPIEDIEFLEMSDFSKTRIPRKVYTDEPVQTQEYQLEPIPEENRYERQAGGGHHDYVDYGAHTGHHGSFGWYADFPVHKGSQ